VGGGTKFDRNYSVACTIACTSSRTPFPAGVAFRLAAHGVFVRDWSVQDQPPATASLGR